MTNINNIRCLSSASLYSKQVKTMAVILKNNNANEQTVHVISDHEPPIEGIKEIVSIIILIATNKIVINEHSINFE
jgi:hypothetical protein